MASASWPALLRPHVAALALAGGLSVVSAAVPGALVALLAPAVRAVGEGDAAGALGHAGWLLAVALLGAVVRVVRTGLSKQVAWSVAEGLRGDLLGCWLQRPAAARVGDRLAALTDEADQVQYGVSAVVTLVRDPLTLVGLGAGALWVAPSMAPLALVLVPVLVGASALTGRWVGAAARRQRAARAELGGLAGEQLLGAEVVRAFGAEEAEQRRFAEVAAADRRARVGMDLLRLSPSVVTELVALGAVAAFVVRGAQLVGVGSLQPEGLVAFVAALVLAQRPVARLAEAWSLWKRASAALERVRAVLDASPPVSARVDPVVHPGPRAVVMRGVELWDGPRRVLGPIDLQAAPGQIVALVGPTGAGKSSLLRLVAGLRAPTRGEVAVGGDALAGWPSAARARVVAWVPQDGFLFARSILDNLRLAAPGLEGAEAKEWLAAAKAGFVAEHPMGLQRGLGEAGSPLSGGERQRLALARALAVEAPVLLLDEPTNQVDLATEAAILATLQQLRPQRTILVACHDLAVALQADVVVVLEAGRVVEQGAPHVLQAAGGAFARLTGST